MKRFGLHSAIWATASTHFIVDAYGNMFAPLLPLLIPQLGLSLKTVGVLAMCYQLASSVSQLGFGTLADRWRPRVLLMAGPILSVVVLSSIGTATSVSMLAAILLIGGLGGAAFHPPAAALVHSVSGDRKGLAMSTHISGGSLGFALAPLVFAPTVVALGQPWAWLVAIPGLLALTYTLQLMRRVPIPSSREGQSWRQLRPYAKPLGLLYIIVVLRTLTANSLSVFLPVLLTLQGMSVNEASAAVSLYLGIRYSGGLSGRPSGGRVWRAARDHLDADCLGAVFVGRPAHVGMDADRADLDWGLPAAVDAARQCDVRSADCPGERCDGVVVDDGLRLGCWFPPCPGRWHPG